MATSNITLDAREFQPAELQPTRVPSLASSQRRADLRSNIGPSALLALAAFACTTSATDTRTILRQRFGLSGIRLDAAVKIGIALSDVTVTNEPLGYLAGVKMTATQSSALLAMLPGSVQSDGAPSELVSATAVQAAWWKRRIGRLARKTIRTRDQPSIAVCAALLASAHLEAQPPRGAAALVAGLSETFMGPKKASTVQRSGDRLVAAAYSMSALSGQGLDLGSEHWSVAPPDWRYRAAPWILPLLDTQTSPALTDLLNAAHARRLAFVTPGQSPFIHDDNLNVVEDTRNRAVGNAANLTRWTDWPVWFSGGPGEVQVLLTQDEMYAYAWVGRDGRGQLVAFDTEDFTAWGLDEPGMVQALAYAIGWYIDVSISLRRNHAGTSTVRRGPGGSRRAGISYRPTINYAGQRASVAQGTHAPPVPHMRAAHIRDLGNRSPSEAALSHAPLRYRRHMGPHQTWVRSASVGGSATHQQIEVHLGSNSALADVLGLMEKAS